MLSNTLPFVIESVLTNSTDKNHFHGWKAWSDWCNSKQEVEDSPTNNHFVQLAYKGCQRVWQWQTTNKEPVTSEMIKLLVNEFGRKSASLPDLRLLFTCLLGFSGFLGIEELLSVKINI